MPLPDLQSISTKPRINGYRSVSAPRSTLGRQPGTSHLLRATITGGPWPWASVPKARMSRSQYSASSRSLFSRPVSTMTYTLRTLKKNWCRAWVMTCPAKSHTWAVTGCRRQPSIVQSHRAMPGVLSSPSRNGWPRRARTVQVFPAAPRPTRISLTSFNGRV